jgi:hypothetical protein
MSPGRANRLVDSGCDTRNPVERVTVPYRSMAASGPATPLSPWRSLRERVGIGGFASPPCDGFALARVKLTMFQEARQLSPGADRCSPSCHECFKSHFELLRSLLMRCAQLSTGFAQSREPRTRSGAKRAGGERAQHLCSCAHERVAECDGQRRGRPLRAVRRIFCRHWRPFMHWRVFMRCAPVFVR